MINSVTIFGGGKISQEDYSMLEELGRLLGQKKIKIVTGGWDGAMEAPAKGAREAGGVAVGYIFNNKHGNKFLTETIRPSTALHLMANL